MSNATPSRLGQINSTGDSNALFLKIFSGEVLTAFDEVRVMTDDRQMIRNITNGKSAQFPVIGTASAAYHTPGTELLGNAFQMNERVIEVNDLLIAHTFVAKIDELKNHYEVRGPYAHELGEALANRFDTNVLSCYIRGARAAANGPIKAGGTTSIPAVSANDGSVLVAAIYEAAEAMDVKDVPSSNRYVAVSPADYYNMITDTASGIINRDFAGQGSIAEGSLPLVGGIQVLKTNHIPNTNVTTGPAAYRGNFTATKSVVFHNAGVGTVRLLNINSEAHDDPRRRGTLMLSEMVVGADFIRPECCFEITQA